MDHLKAVMFSTFWNLRFLFFIISVSGPHCFRYLIQPMQSLHPPEPEWNKIGNSLILPISALSALLPVCVSWAAQNHKGTYTRTCYQQRQDCMLPPHCHQHQGRILEIMQSFTYSTYNVYLLSDFYISKPESFVSGSLCPSGGRQRGSKSTRQRTM